jgi:hypothetical protein
MQMDAYEANKLKCLSVITWHPLLLDSTAFLKVCSGWGAMPVF